MIKNRKLYFLLFGLAFALSACKSKTVLITESTSQPVPIDSIYRTIFNPSSINWFTGRAKIKFEGEDDNQKAVMFIRVKTDSIVWTSIKKFGAEVGRSLINPDSVVILNRLDKTFQVLTLNQLYRQFGLTPDLESIQKLVFGQMPKIDTFSLWQVKEDSEFYKFRSIKDDIVFDFNFDKYTGQLSSGHFFDRFELTGHWDYEDYRLVQGVSIPFYRKYSIEFEPGNYLNITLEFTDIEINKPENTGFTIYDHYQKIP